LGELRRSQKAELKNWRGFWGKSAWESAPNGDLRVSMQALEEKLRIEEICRPGFSPGPNFARWNK